MRRCITTILCLLLALAWTRAAEPVGEWQVYPSYWLADQHVQAGQYVYSLAGGNLLRYDVEDTEVQTYDCLHQLSDMRIVRMAYCQEAKTLVLLYENGNVDLIDREDRIVNVAALKDKAMSGKDMYDIYLDGTTAYLCTGFGLVLLDVQEGVIRDTYEIGLAVTSMIMTENDIWLATRTGIYTAPRSGVNLHLSQSWTRTSTAEGITSMAIMDGHIYALHPEGVLEVLRRGTQFVRRGQFACLRLLADGTLAYSDESNVYLRTQEGTEHIVPTEGRWSDISQRGNTYWVSEGERGLRAYRLQDGAVMQTLGPVQPNSPQRDLFYRMHFVGNRLLVAGGIINYYKVNYPGTAMMWQDGEWSHLDDGYAKEWPQVWHLNFTHMAQDPNDEDHLFVGSFRNGLYEFRGGKFTHLYNCDNSPICSILPHDENYLSYCSATGAQYDMEGNLWILNDETDTIVRYLDPKGRWHSLYYPEMKGTTTATDYLFSSSGVRFILSMRNTTRGIFAFDPGTTLANVRDDKHILRTTIVNQDGTSYSPSEFYCLCEDQDGRVWCGTEQGLFIINDPLTYFDTTFQFEQIKIAREDGSGLADYLLSGVPITCIVVDGANRKWIGTSANGLYLVSADGQEMIQHFMSDDSPLISDNIQCLALDQQTGRLMIGTDRGLCSYMTDARQAEEELDVDHLLVYPNPVTPDYTGPITIDGLTQDAEVKICSSSGQLVWSGTSNGGRLTWNGTNAQGRRVASGVYHVIANTRDGKRAIVTRIIVIR